jgi:hypothetical protein
VREVHVHGEVLLLCHLLGVGHVERVLVLGLLMFGGCVRVGGVGAFCRGTGRIGAVILPFAWGFGQVRGR